MSIRAVILGLLGGAFIAAACFVNDRYVGTDVLVGHHLPISVFGTVALVGMVINPLLYRIHPPLRLRTTELATAMILMLVACGVPGMSFGQNFAPILAMPAQQNLLNAGWRKHDVLSYTPSSMLPAGGAHDEEVLGGYIDGHQRMPFGLGDVPWRKWQGPLETWMPLAVLLAVATICLSLVVHRQWSDHERLRYPIAEVAGALTAQEEGRAVGPLFREKFFWTAFIIVLVVRLGVGAYNWQARQDEHWLRLDFRPVLTKFPSLGKVPGQKYVARPLIYPAGIGFAFFLASDVSLGIGLSVYLHFALMAVMLKTGMAMQDEPFNGGVFTWQRFGSCLGIALVLAKTGRQYYWQVLKGAFGARRQDEVDHHAIWACRFLILAAGGAAAILVALGLDWPLAVLLILLILLFYLTAARFSAEAGLFFITSLWQPAAVMVGLIGGFALGPKGIIIIGLMMMIFAHDPREALMPFVVNALKIGQNVGIRPGRIGPSAVAVYVMALAVAMPTMLWASYKLGAGSAKRYEAENKTWSKLTYNAAEKAMTEMSNRGELEQSIHLGTAQRLSRMRPDKLFLYSAGAGLVIVLVFSTLRLRYTWWPIHPIMFCVWGTQSMKALSASFLLGWIIKGALSRLGLLTGGRIARVKALMVGMIAGDLLAGVVFMIVGAVYYAITGLTPPEYYIFPH
ncbi:MAG: hypothetical protein MUP47_10485 [Phycisphaerae bacterium]|nr:hypothetical protein [Phycisphaerae bacterium]